MSLTVSNRALDTFCLMFKHPAFKHCIYCTFSDMLAMSSGSKDTRQSLVYDGQEVSPHTQTSDVKVSIGNFQNI